LRRIQMAKKKKDMSWLLDDEDTSIWEVVDANGNTLLAWDTIVAIKDLKVKGANDIKRWDKFKNIRLTDDIELIESGKMVLRTEFFKKV
jgi:uncharacterized Zn ribbon protein